MSDGNKEFGKHQAPSAEKKSLFLGSKCVMGKQQEKLKPKAQWAIKLFLGLVARV